MEADINFLLAMAMERLVFLPFAYTIDQFRSDNLKTLLSLSFLREALNKKFLIRETLNLSTNADSITNAMKRK